MERHSFRIAEAVFSHQEIRWNYGIFCSVYNEPNLNLDKLGELDKCAKIHIKNTITLLTEVYKTTRGENPIPMNKFSPRKKQHYNLQITNFLNFPK